MAEFRMVVRHTGYWRTRVHHWSTVYPYVSAGGGVSMTPLGLDHIAQGDSDMCYFGPDNDQGCVYQVDFYSVDLGGVPVLSKSYGDGDDPASGTLVGGHSWITPTNNAEPTREVALIADWPAGLGRTGKPVYFRKYYHAVPQSLATGFAPDVNATDHASLNGQLTYLQNALTPFGLQMGNSRRLAGDPATVRQYYGNHQMPRGRRHKKLATSAFKPGSYVVISPPSD